MKQSGPPSTPPITLLSPVRRVDDALDVFIELASVVEQVAELHAAGRAVGADDLTRPIDHRHTAPLTPETGARDQHNVYLLFVQRELELRSTRALDVVRGAVITALVNARRIMAPALLWPCLIDALQHALHESLDRVRRRLRHATPPDVRLDAWSEVRRVGALRAHLVAGLRRRSATAVELRSALGALVEQRRALRAALDWVDARLASSPYASRPKRISNSAAA